jgi:hypothetical protein
MAARCMRGALEPVNKRERHTDSSI